MKEYSVGDELYCHTNHAENFFAGHFYEIREVNPHSLTIWNDSKNNHPASFYFRLKFVSNFFYTQKQLREMKLKEIDGTRKHKTGL